MSGCPGVKLAEYDPQRIDIEAEATEPVSAQLRWRFKRDAHGNVLKDATGRPIKYAHVWHKYKRRIVECTHLHVERTLNETRGHTLIIQNGIMLCVVMGRESNARLVKYKDGSMAFFVGSVHYNVKYQHLDK